MHRLIGLFAVLAMTSTMTGCLRHQVRGGCGSTCNTCESGCETAACETPSVGLLNRIRCGSSNCNSRGDCNQCGDCGGGCGGGMCGQMGSCLMGGGNCGCRPGCVAGPLGWQQGGLNYSGCLQPGLMGHGAGAQLNSTPFTPGPPTAQVAYPYYSVRGPRDFFLDNPPTIGR